MTDDMPPTPPKGVTYMYTFMYKNLYVDDAAGAEGGGQQQQQGS